MSNQISNNKAYNNWLIDLKTKIKQCQFKASLAVNSELILLYWDLGKQIVEKQTQAKWGTGFINQLSIDLNLEFPQMSGFSRTNLFAIKKFYLFHNQHCTIVPQAGGQLKNKKNNTTKSLSKPTSKVPQPGGQLTEIMELCCQIPWKHNITIIEKIKKTEEVSFYLTQTIANNWSRAVLEYQIESNLFHRQGKTISNFKYTLPNIQGDLAQQLLKDPYHFEFLSLSKLAKEKDLEQKLIQHIAQFLLELGKGFAYMGKQYLLQIGRKEYRIDLLFYHTKLKCYVVIELKMVEFEPEHIGKLNFYVNAIDEMVKESSDQATIGILLCKNKDNYEVDFSIKGLNNPLCVSEFNYTELPQDIKNALPTQEEFEIELMKIGHH